jgi:hypothetical protein
MKTKKSYSYTQLFDIFNEHLTLDNFPSDVFEIVAEWLEANEPGDTFDITPNSRTEMDAIEILDGFINTGEEKAVIEEVKEDSKEFFPKINLNDLWK